MQHNVVTANETFQRAYGGDKNFMTPNIIRRGWKNGMCYELSHGIGFGGDDIYGVTVLTEQAEKVSDRNGCFTSRDKAEKHIKDGLPIFWNEVKR